MWWEVLGGFKQLGGLSSSSGCSVGTDFKGEGGGSKESCGEEVGGGILVRSVGGLD